MPNVERGTRYTIQARDLFNALLARQIAGPAWIKFPADAAGELVGEGEEPRELADLRGRRIVRHLVWAIPDPVIESLARERGILVHLYRPSWLEPMLAALRPRQTAATQPRGLLDELPGEK